MEDVLNYLQSKKISPSKIARVFSLLHAYGLNVASVNLFTLFMDKKTICDNITMLYDIVLSIPREERTQKNLFMNLLYW